MSPDMEFVYGFYRLFPGESVDKAFTLMSVYTPSEVPEDADPTPWVEVHNLVREVVSTEDYRVAAQAQYNLMNSPEDFHFVFGTNEIALQNYHRNINKVLEE